MDSGRVPERSPHATRSSKTKRLHDDQSGGLTVKRRSLGFPAPRSRSSGSGATRSARRIDEAATVEVINAALDLGINFVDTVIVYGQGESEKLHRDRG